MGEWLAHFLGARSQPGRRRLLERPYKFLGGPSSATLRIELLAYLFWIALIGVFLECQAEPGPGQNADQPRIPLLSQEQAYPSTHLQTNKTVFLGAYSMDLLDSQQKLGVGDRIFLRVIEDQEEPISQTITDAGEIYVPELGLVSAAGKTCRQLAFELKAKLEQTAYYQATVIAGIESLNKTLSGRKVFITGQVRVTSPLDIPAGESWTVSKIIMRAGGFTEFADKKRVRLIRGSSKAELSRAYTINVSEIWDKARTDRDLLVEPGDLIFVPARVINF